MDFQTAHEARLSEVSDLDVVQIAADSGRLLVTHDKRTMPSHFFRFITNRRSPGVIILPKDVLIRIAVEELSLIWTASEAEEWRNRLVWIPL